MKKWSFKKIEQKVGSARFAVLIILTFAAALAVGTFVESYHGADYANRLVYKSLPFIFLQFLMFWSILTATLLRLPFKKRLAGFYVLHAGLLILLAGSFVTYWAGVDGQLVLMPNTPARDVELSRDQLHVSFDSSKKSYKIDLPYVSGPIELDDKISNLTLLKFLPYADDQVEWREISKENQKNFGSGHYLLANDQFSQKIWLSLHPDSTYSSTTQLGPLSLHFLPEGLWECFKAEQTAELLFWDESRSQCVQIPKSKIKTMTTAQKTKVISFSYRDQRLNFLPELFPLPFDENLQRLPDAPLKLFNRSKFEQGPQLFVFGQKGVSFFEKDSKIWESKKFHQAGAAIDLPWMGFRLSLLEHKNQVYAVKVPKAVRPIQKQNKIVRGKIKAIQVEVEGRKVWVRDSERSVQIPSTQGEIRLALGKEKLRLPYQIHLQKFHMDLNPGTRDPASYESHVSVFDGEEAIQQKIFMNNPLDYRRMTFYQSSYFPTEGGNGSVLTVNFDPGRPWKYLGCVLLILGTLWHFGPFKPKKKSGAP